VVITIDIIIDALNAGLIALFDYLAQHVLTCLVPAFFIAGAIAALVKKDAILKYFGPDVKKIKSYTVASVSGTILAVCSCTILPLFAGIYKKGSGLGPAVTFLFAGPAINVLAIIYTATVLGMDIGIARAVAAVSMSIIVGLIMAYLFRKTESKRDTTPLVTMKPNKDEIERPRWVTPTFFALLIGILVFGSSQLDWVIKLAIVYVLTLGVAVILIYHYNKQEVTDWGMETWDLTKKIFPILIVGTFFLGIFSFFVPPETFRPYLGDNGLGANLLASVLGAVLYMPTLLEVPLIGTTFGYTSGVIASGPALALLLSGPTTSLPSIVVLAKIVGWKMTLTYWFLVIIMATIAGVTFGFLVG
jgi:uncharacterized protein